MAAATVTAAAASLLGAVPATAAVSCASPVWKAQFYANTTFSGTPKRTACDTAINENYGTGDPAGVTLPRDNFSVRWTMSRNFGSGGPFTLYAAARDGVRVYVDGVRRIDMWRNVSTTQSRTVHVTIPSGTHTLRVDFVAWTGYANVKFSYAPLTSAGVDKVRPLAPTGVTAVYSATGRAATVRWARNPEMDLAGYRVYRRLSGSSTWTKVSGTALLTGTSATNTLPATGQTFYYEVRAVDKAGHESAGSTDRAVTTVDRTPPAAPFIEMDACPDNAPYAAPEFVTTTANRAGIAWYEAQRRNPATGAWTTVYSGAKGAFCDTGQPADGSRVTYRGRARDAAGNWSAYSPVTTVTLSDRTPPAAPGVRADYRSGVPHLVWTPVTGAVSYEVFQYDPATGGYLDALGARATTTGTDVVPHQQLDVGDWYRYAVRALDAAGNGSALREITLSMPERPGAPSPYGLRAMATGYGVVLTWYGADPWAADKDHLPTYLIERTDPATGDTVTLDKCAPYASDGPDVPPTSYPANVRYDTDPEYAAARDVVYSDCIEATGASETTYEYRIVAVDRYGHHSGPGAPVTITTADTRRPAPVVGLTAEPVPFGVRLSWSPPADDDVLGYYVWQSTTDPNTGETVWEKNCWAGESPSGTEMLCPTLPDGREHSYRVAATDAEFMDQGIDFFHTAEVSVTLPDTLPPGWSGTTITEDAYPDLYMSCGETIFDMPCGDFTDYRWERWDPGTGSWTTLTTGKVNSAAVYMDTTVHEDPMGLYYYRAVYSGGSGAEQVVRQSAFGIWGYRY
ncbi:PA14 domain-containing protein [Streptacidiphilus griseoplanus]|uniref:PA14 domain-containing protein n=1 Tax=Peterkaempfera griseoplana TaxID=66896 RepID=UPI001FE1F52D|nr:PA14 domain-containing protein [Peterkaempfera griseoplana]